MSTAPETFRVLASGAAQPLGPNAGQAPDIHTLAAHREGSALGGSAAEAASHAVGVRPLTELPLRTPAYVVALVPPNEPHDPEIIARLGELGFLPGEPVRVIARAFMGDPLAVRVGTGTFALRRSEARCIHVRLEA